MNKYEQIKQMSLEEMAQEFMLCANWNPKDKVQAEKVFGKNNIELFIAILSKEVEESGVRIEQ